MNTFKSILNNSLIVYIASNLLTLFVHIDFKRPEKCLTLVLVFFFHANKLFFSKFRFVFTSNKRKKNFMAKTEANILSEKKVHKTLMATFSSSKVSI